MWMRGVDEGCGGASEVLAIALDEDAVTAWSQVRGEGRGGGGAPMGGRLEGSDTQVWNKPMCIHSHQSVTSLDDRPRRLRISTG